MDQIQTLVLKTEWKTGDLPVYGQVMDKESVHTQDLLHYSVHLLILDSKNNILCRKRKVNDFRYADLWTSSIGTHVLYGSDYLKTLKPLLPIKIKIDFIGEFRVHDAWENEINGLYVCRIDKEELPPDFLIDRSYLSNSELMTLILELKTTPHLREAFGLLKNKGVVS